MSEEVLDELAALSAIYCDKDEFQLLEGPDEKGAVFSIQVTAGQSAGQRVPLRLLFRLPPGYPHPPGHPALPPGGPALPPGGPALPPGHPALPPGHPAHLPDVSVWSEQLSRKQCCQLRAAVLQQAAALEPGVMVLQLVHWVQETLPQLELQEERRQREEEEEERRREQCAVWTALLLVDHMRSRERYLKMIRRWTSELQLAGRLFLGPRILLVLQGPHANIKEFIHLQRTVKVDVDSSGKRCKERMMKILYEQSSSSSSSEPKQMSSFEVLEFPSLDQMKSAFEDVGQLELFQEFVPT